MVEMGVENVVGMKDIKVSWMSRFVFFFLGFFLIPFRFNTLTTRSLTPDPQINTWSSSAHDFPISTLFHPPNLPIDQIHAP